MWILIVEDHADSRNLLAWLLRSAGHLVRAAEDGTAALAACDQQAFDLIVSDIGLPDLDGWELLGLIRLRQAIKAIALSAFTAPADLAHSRAAGFDAHLGKPLDFKLLAAAMTQLVE
jgi:CheY-like chemotaxis protein